MVPSLPDSYGGGVEQNLFVHRRTTFSPLIDGETRTVALDDRVEDKLADGDIREK